MEIVSISNLPQETLDVIVSIHQDAFPTFFLTSLGPKFLKLMYQCHMEHKASDILVAIENSVPIGFLAYSEDMSDLYSYMLKRHGFYFALYSIIPFLKNPIILPRLLRAFLKPKEAKQLDKYIYLASAGVTPKIQSKGTYSSILNTILQKYKDSDFQYIIGDTDVGNGPINHIYHKFGFNIHRQYETPEGRPMYEQRYYFNT